MTSRTQTQSSVFSTQSDGVRIKYDTEEFGLDHSMHSMNCNVKFDDDKFIIYAEEENIGFGDIRELSHEDLSIDSCCGKKFNWF